MARRPFVLVSVLVSLFVGAARAEDAATPASPILKATIRAPRDMGFFVGDIVRSTADIFVASGFELVEASLPHPGPVNYWLDLKSIVVTQRADGGGRTHYTLAITYQDFYDALDARPQEIPTFEITFKRGTETRSAFVPAWTIGVSPLREVAPPVKEDPRDYLRADAPAPLVKTDGFWTGAVVTLLAAVLALLLLLYDRAVWPFRARADRVFGETSRALQRLSPRPDTDERYVEALLLIHRGIDRTDGRRVLSDDLAVFLARHPAFSIATENLTNFFAASRHAFFGSDLARARAAMPFRALERLTQKLAAAERTR